MTQIVVRPDLLHYQLAQAGLPVVGVSSDGRVDYDRELTPTEVATAIAIIAAHDKNAPTPAEIDDQTAAQSRISFKNIPNWATWTPDEAKTYVTGAVLSGQTKEQINASIDASVTNLATAITALKLLAGAIVDLRTILAIVSSAILMLRDQVIRRHMS